MKTAIKFKNRAIVELLHNLNKELFKLDTENYIFHYSISSKDLDYELDVSVYEDFTYVSKGVSIYKTDFLFGFNGYITEENKGKIETLIEKIREIQ